ncbi:MAG: double-strand break repair helicase AddA [Proteobacteria bacterium]|nr:double-strand break repair helicase AddA [Pseudomonadota bacterium]
MKSNPSHPFPPLNLTASLWVEASAGSGKTKILTDRVLSFLIDGVSPHRLLCLTYTKAAAAEMEARILKTLSTWVYMDEASLIQQIEYLMGRAPASSDIERARNLLRKSFDLKIQTFHSFCHSLLEQFPMEGDIPPYFSIADEEERQIFIKNLTSSLLFLGNSNFSLKESLETLLPFFSSSSFEEMLEKILNQIPILETFLTSYEFQNKSPESADSFLEKSLNPPELPKESLVLYSRLLCDGETLSSQEKGLFLEEFLTQENGQKKALYSQYRDLFLTLEKGPRKNILKKALQEKYPVLFDALLKEQIRLLNIEEQYRTLLFLSFNHAFYILSSCVLKEYQNYKFSKNTLDYTDLLLKTCNLLKDPHKAPWVFYKLDTGIDHILLDEAQDTNSLQWEILTLLLTHLKENHSSPLSPKTLFVVGDEKQSIYSFQGANPLLFKEKNSFFKRQALEKNESWHAHALSLSYRSTEAVLKTVDTVFKDPDSLRGVSFSQEEISHEIWRHGHPGSVELWPLLRPLSSQEEGSDFKEAPKQISPPERILAQTIATEIQKRCQEADPLPSTQKPLSYGDILILVRKRSRLIDELTYFLKNKGIPVNGRDRILLKDHLSIQDLLILAAWSLSPFDDLSLATSLKGPFFDFCEEDLFQLCFGRTETLFETLKKHQDCTPKLKKTVQKLTEIKELSEKTSPFDFFNLLLTKYEGRSLLLSRFGGDVQDLLDEFLTILYDLDRLKGFSLYQCIHWFQTTSLVVKRDLESQSFSSIRIMTIHGSKGLEAPLVILPDTSSLPLSFSGFSLYVKDQTPLFIPPKEFRPKYIEEILDQAYDKILEEYRRLFYVALTRAQDHLILAGYLGSSTTQLPLNSWYSMAQKALQELGKPKSFHFLEGNQNAWSGEGYLYKSSQISFERKKKEEKDHSSCLNLHQKPVVSFSDLPSWIFKPAPTETLLIKTLFPSQLEESDRAPSFLESTLEYGRILHFLLEKLPFYPSNSHENVAHLLIKKSDLQEKDLVSKLIQTALRILKKPEFSFLFGPGSFGEVPLIGTHKGQKISGRIDRLILGKNEIWIVDYKTDKDVPLSPCSLKPAYKLQLSLYGELLKKIYPNTLIRTGILWLQTETFMEIV